MLFSWNSFSVHTVFTPEQPSSVPGQICPRATPPGPSALYSNLQGSNTTFWAPFLECHKSTAWKITCQTLRCARSLHTHRRDLQRQHNRKAASLSHTQGYSGEIEGYHCLLGETTWERSSHQVCQRTVWQYLAESTRCKTQAHHLLCASHHPPQPQQTAFLYSETVTGQHPQKEHQHDLSTVPPPTARLSSAGCCHQTSKAMLWSFEQLSHLSQKIHCHCFFLCITHSHWHSRRLGFPSCAKDLVWPSSLVFQDNHICLAVTHMWVCHSCVCQPPWLSSKLWSQRNLGRKTLVYPAEGTCKTFWSYLFNFNNFLSITESPLRQMMTRQSPAYPAAPTWWQPCKAGASEKGKHGAWGILGKGKKTK